MPFVEAAATPVALRHGIGIAIMVTRAPDMHVGILYGKTASETGFLHLGTHNQLSDDAAPPCPYHWSDCEWLGTAKYLGGLDHLLNVIDQAVRRGDVAYGYVPPSDLYDGAGHLLKIAATEGVTCATYVALFFKAAGFPVLDLAEWRPRPGDADGRQGVLDHLRRRHPERYEVIKDQDMPFRLYPHEVATAATRDRIPTRFSEAADLSRNLYRTLLPSHAPPGQPGGNMLPG